MISKRLIIFIISLMLFILFAYILGVNLMSRPIDLTISIFSCAGIIFSLLGIELSMIISG
jgi:hypothetical protein